MLGPFSMRLLTLLQFTRMALVFTAISNLQASYLISTASGAESFEQVLQAVDPIVMLALAMVSVGLYGFGMTLNDIVDHRRDLQIAADRPLPSGRLGVRMAHVVCAGLGLLACGGGWLIHQHMPDPWLSLVVLIATGFMIVFYDVAGKYLVAMGLLSLGMIRLLHALIADPSPVSASPSFPHAMFLLVHVTAISTVAYALEQKRPTLTRPHILIVVAGTTTMALVVAAWIGNQVPPQQLLQHLGLSRLELILPLLCGIAFVLLAQLLIERDTSSRSAGKNVMLLGLLWLIVYDAAFVAAFVSPKASLLVLSLLPVAYLSVRAMRLWSKLTQLAQPPAYIRAT
jgi:4-hydroxybenzoate polyprenyltransferase